MKLLFTVYYPIFGGPHSQALRLEAALGKRGWETIVLVPTDSGNAADRLSEAGIRVVKTRLHRLRAKPDPRVHLGYIFGLIGEIKRLRRIIREYEIDLVVVNGLANPQCALAAKLESRPVAWQLIDTLTPILLRRLLMPLVTRWGDVILATGKGVARVHPGTASVGERLRIFYPPVDTELFRPDLAQRIRARQILGLAPDDVVIGNVSNINPQKGHATFIRAADRLRRQHPNARFVILGAQYPNHAEYATGLWQLASRLGLRFGHELIVKDAGSQVADLALAFDVFWLTPEPMSEGVPTVVVEAMAMGLPVVATEVGAVAEVVEDGVTGFVVRPGDFAAVASATATLLEDPTGFGRMGAAARRRAVDQYAVGHSADLQVSAYELAMQHHAQSGGKRRSVRLSAR